MRPFESLIPYAEALAKALAACAPVDGTEQVALAAAVGRVAGETVKADGDVPARSRAAMDGYALAAAAGRGPLPLAGFSHLGRPFPGSLPPGACVEIATGALLPEGADCVVMVEEATREGGTVSFQKAPKSGQHVSEPGEDLRRGDILVEAGRLVHPGVLAVLAASGRDRLTVRRRPVVAHATGGDEVVAPGGSLRGPDGVFDTNNATVAALAAAHGAEARSLGIVPDAIEALVGAVARGTGADLLVFSGGTSVGPKDFTLDVLGPGTELLFRGVAVKPGRPTLLGRLEDGRLFLGLPGYPVSCLMMGYAFLAPMLRRLAGLPARWGTRDRMRLAEAWPAVGNLHTFVTVKAGPDGVRACYRKSSTITSFSEADGLVERPAGDPARAAGDPVDVLWL